LKRINERRKRKSLERIDHWTTLLDIATAPHTEKASGVRSLHAHFKRIRQLIENDGKAVTDAEQELQNKIVKLNKRRRKAV